MLTMAESTMGGSLKAYEMQMQFLREAYDYNRQRYIAAMSGCPKCGRRKPNKGKHSCDGCGYRRCD